MRQNETNRCKKRQNVQKETQKKAKSAAPDPGLDALTPRAASLDARGRVLYAPEEYAKPVVPTQTVALRPWMDLVDGELKLDAYKSTFRSACWNFQQQHRLLQQDIVIIRKGTEVLVKTTAAVAANRLVIPMFSGNTRACARLRRRRGTNTITQWMLR